VQVIRLYAEVQHPEARIARRRQRRAHRSENEVSAEGRKSCNRAHGDVQRVLSIVRWSAGV
jgi:hypothetical protein